MSARLSDYASILARKEWDALLANNHAEAYGAPDAAEPLPWCRGERVFMISGIIAGLNLSALACAQAGSLARMRDARLSAIEARLTGIERMLEALAG
jgi:hypothetical protein